MKALVYSVVVAGGLAWLLQKLGVPAGALIGGMVGIGALKMSGVEVPEIPAAGRFVVYTAIGWLLGQSFTTQTPRLVADQLLPIMGVVVAYIAAGGLLAFLLWRFTSLDAITAYLATAPGAIAQMGALSAQVGAQVPIVVSIHLLRVTTVILITPLVARFFAGDA